MKEREKMLEACTVVRWSAQFVQWSPYV